mgnify:CR=1 FL=1
MEGNNYNVVVIGLGYVGLTYSLYLNQLGFRVIGIEKSKHLREKIKQKELPFYEKGLSKLLINSIDSSMLKVLDNREFLIENKSDENYLYIISVGTPVGNSKIKYTAINGVIKFLEKILKGDDSICFRSTLPIGYTFKAMDQLKTYPKYCFAPERTIEGSAIEELSNLPQVFGCDNERSRIFFRDFFKKTSKEILELESSRSAELLKLSSNVYRDVTFSLANEIAKICYDNDINSADLISAINYRYDRCNLATPGPVAGPCISKDTYILFENEREKAHKTTSLIFKARKVNENYILSIINDIITKNFKTKFNVSILGLAFKGKPLTSDIRDSYALKIIEKLNKNNLVKDIYCFDSKVHQDDFDKNKIQRKFLLEDCFKDDLIIIQNNQDNFKNLEFQKLTKNKKSKTVIFDLWALNNDFTSTDLIKYISL